MLAAVGLFGTSFDPLSTFWAARILLGWIVAICLETLVRLVGTIFVPADHDKVPVAPVHLLLREALRTIPAKAS